MTPKRPSETIPGTGATAPATDAARGRELVLAALCHLESFDADDRADALEAFLSDPPRDEEGLAITASEDAAVRRHARRILDDLLARWSQLDAQLDATSKRWRLDRMDKIDRNALRLGAAELTSPGRTVPAGVVVAEAVRVASRYGSERSGRFVNGILSDLRRSAEGADDDHGRND